MTASEVLYLVGMVLGGLVIGLGNLYAAAQAWKALVLSLGWMDGRKTESERLEYRGGRR